MGVVLQLLKFNFVSYNLVTLVIVFTEPQILLIKCTLYYTITYMVLTKL